MTVLTEPVMNNNIDTTDTTDPTEIADNSEISELSAIELARYRQQLDCGFASVEAVLPQCLSVAKSQLTDFRLSDYLDAANRIGKFGRGDAPVIAFLESWPAAGARFADGALAEVMELIGKLQQSPNSAGIVPLLQSLTAVDATQLTEFLALLEHLLTETTGSIHRQQLTQPSPGLPTFLARSAYLLANADLSGIRHWMDYGIALYRDHPPKQAEYFALDSTESIAMFQRQRAGTALFDIESNLGYYQQCFWNNSDLLIGYSRASAQLAAADDIELSYELPYYDDDGIRLPDILDSESFGGVDVSGLDRYRMRLAHMLAHQQYSQKLVADNWSPIQRLAVEVLEDARVDSLILRRFPGSRQTLLALHPAPLFDACPSDQSSVRHRLTMLSRACLDQDYFHQYCQHSRSGEEDYLNDYLIAAVEQFTALLVEGGASTAEISSLALRYISKSRSPSDQLSQMYFDDTTVDYRDDNRHLWRFIEAGDEEESFTQPEQASVDEPLALAPRLYPEWDYALQYYRPDWVSVYEQLQATGKGGDQVVEDILQKNHALLQQIKRIIDRLKPQDRQRLRFQESGNELDLDLAIRSLTDFAAGADYNPRIYDGQQHQHRDFAVLILMDLSESLNEKIAGTEQSVLSCAQESVALLGTSMAMLGDKFAIAGFHSDTRDRVSYQHIKGFSESWSTPAKARLAGIEAGYSTRMGAAIRHAEHYLANQQADKKLLLVLTDGKPADIDVTDEMHLVHDSRKAVVELQRQQISSYCVSLDKSADDYVSQIFGKHYSVIDRVEALPDQLPKLFLALTK